MAIEDKDLTGGGREEAGLFDELMRSLKTHVKEEMDNSRITGDNYAKVYLGVTNQALQTALQFVLQRDLTNKQIELAEKELEKADKEIALLDKQAALIDAQIAQIHAETALTEQRKLTEVENTGLVAQQKTNAVSQNRVIENQANKLEKDIELVQEQIFNAQAQRKDQVDGQTVAGSIGKQKELYQAQIDGFTRDAEQKLAKMLLDTWSVSRTTNDAVEVPNNANNTSIDEVLAIARQGIGITP